MLFWSANNTPNGLNMQFNNLSEFLAMGGYGYYVWMSFGVTAAAMVLEMWLLKAQRKSTLQGLKTRLRMAAKQEENA